MEPKLHLELWRRELSTVNCQRQTAGTLIDAKNWLWVQGWVQRPRRIDCNYEEGLTRDPRDGPELLWTWWQCTSVPKVPGGNPRNRFHWNFLILEQELELWELFILVLNRNWNFYFRDFKEYWCAVVLFGKKSQKFRIIFKISAASQPFLWQTFMSQMSSKPLYLIRIFT